MYLLYSTLIAIYKLLLSWTSLTGRLYWLLVLHIFSSIIKTWGYKGCLKHKLLEHVGNNIFLFAPVPKAAEPFSSETALASCLRHTLTGEISAGIVDNGNKQLRMRL